MAQVLLVPSVFDYNMQRSHLYNKKVWELAKYADFSAQFFDGCSLLHRTPNSQKCKACMYA